MTSHGRVVPTGEVAALSVAVAVLGAALVLLWPVPSSAQDDKATNPSEYLAKIADADRATYQARELVVYFGPPQSAAVLDVRSSGDGDFLRAEAGSVVTRLWRNAAMGAVSSGGDSITDATSPSVPLEPRAVMAKYEVGVEPAQDILGVKVVPLALVRRDDHATVERLWVHEPSGVVYRRELYGLGGKLIGMSTIVDMRWGRNAPVDPFVPGTRAPSRATTMKPSGVPTRLADGYTLLHAYRLHLHGRSVDQLLYTDGLHALSVFRCPGNLRAPRGFVPAALGATRGWVGPGPGTWAWQGAGASWVLVAEEAALDPGTLTEVFPRGGPSVWARMGSVWARAFRAIGGLFT